MSFKQISVCQVKVLLSDATVAGSTEASTIDEAASVICDTLCNDLLSVHPANPHAHNDIMLHQRTRAELLALIVTGAIGQFCDVHPDVVRPQFPHKHISRKGNEAVEHIPVGAHGPGLQAGGPAVEQECFFGAGQARFTRNSEQHGVSLQAYSSTDVLRMKW
jgi:hypothetical protein